MPANDTVTLGDLMAWLTRRWWVVALAAVVGALLGGLGAAAQEQTYVSSTSVLVRPLPTEISSGTRVNLDTEAQVVRSTTTAELVRAELGTDTPPRVLLQRLTVSVPANTSVLVITFQGSSPVQAQAGAAAFAAVYLDQRAEEAQLAIDFELGVLNDQLDELNDQLADATRALAAAEVGSVEHRQAQQLQQSIASQVVNVQGRILPLESVQVQPGSVLSPAELPSTPTDPNPVLFAASGLVAGLLLGLAAALLIHRLDSRIRHRSDLPAAASGRVLMDVPGRRTPAAVARPETPLGREFSRVRNVLRINTALHDGGDDNAKVAAGAGVLLVCGVTAGPASGFATANLAASFARVGERVVVVVAHPQSSSLQMFGVAPDENPGLLGVINGRTVAATAVTESPTVSGVSVLPPGGEDLPELQVGPIINLVLSLRKRADRVIIETAPASQAIDAQALSVASTGLLLVVQRQRTHAAEVAQAIREFELVQAPLMGLLLMPGSFRATPTFFRVPVPRPGAVAPVSPGPPRLAFERADGHEPAGEPEPAEERGHRDEVDAAELPSAGTRSDDTTLVIPRLSFTSVAEHERSGLSGEHRRGGTGGSQHDR